MMATKRGFLIAQIALLSPALLFLAAVGIQMVHALGPAQQIVMLYAGKMWTLWILLIALPLAVLASSWKLLRSSRESTDSRWLLPLSRAVTTTAGIILAIVAVHMAAN